VPMARDDLIHISWGRRTSAFGQPMLVACRFILEKDWKPCKAAPTCFQCVAALAIEKETRHWTTGRIVPR